ncbi:hypothetical protein A4X03_0g8823, partial [Tilletia caries]
LLYPSKVMPRVSVDSDHQLAFLRCMCACLSDVYCQRVGSG